MTPNHQIPPKKEAPRPSNRKQNWSRRAASTCGQKRKILSFALLLLPQMLASSKSAPSFGFFTAGPRRRDSAASDSHDLTSASWKTRAPLQPPHPSLCFPRIPPGGEGCVCVGGVTGEGQAGGPQNPTTTTRLFPPCCGPTDGIQLPDNLARARDPLTPPAFMLSAPINSHTE